MGKNENLHAAKTGKNDEFYTQLEDIELEMSHYRQHFVGKTIFCNCDDPTWSNFWRYFHVNFADLGLKKLISTHYDREGNPSYMMEYSGGNDLDINAGTVAPLEGDGDFRSPECIELLKKADVVVTNPPFSQYREYVAQLMEYEKKFIIIGNLNCITYKEFFPLIKDNKVWPGFQFNKTVEFIMPDNYKLKGKAFIDELGRKHGFVPAVCWFTNLDITKRHTPFFDPESVHARYEGNEDYYPKYDNYDAINVDKTKDIPEDYYEAMGVPITFLDKYNPEEFEIIGCADYTGKYGSDEVGIKRIGEEWMEKYRRRGGRGHYTANMTSLVYYDNTGRACNTFKRILIRRR